MRAIDGDRVPPHLPTMQDKDVLAKNPIYVKLHSFAKYIASRPKSPFYTQMSDVFQKELQEAILGRKSIDEAIEISKEEIEELLE